MASPWSFLTRLVSPRRQKTQDGGSIEEVKPDDLAIAGSTETPVKENLNLDDQPTRERAHLFLQSEPVAEEPEPLAEAGSGIRVSGESKSTDGGRSSDPALPHITDSGAYATPKVDATVNPAPVNRRRHAKKITRVAVVAQAAPVVPTISDEMSLDQEIRALRGQLASKLRLQNKQLTQMLERFER